MSRTRLAVAALAGTVALSAATAAPARTDELATAICPRYASFFHVELGASGEFVSAYAYTSGGPVGRGGTIQYVWVGPRDSKLDRGCRRVRSTPQGSTAELRPPVRLEEGQFYYERYKCAVRGRLVVHTKPLTRNGTTVGHYLGVKLEGRRALLIAATVGLRQGTIRVSRRCERDPI